MAEQRERNERKWILCIEDNPDDLELIKEILPKERYPLTWAKDGAEGLRQIESIHFDLILLDHGLPDTNSLAFIDAIRAIRPDVPVVILTGRDDDILNVSAMRKGAAAYVVKDLMGSYLRQTIDHITQLAVGDRTLENMEDGSLLLRQRMEHIYFMLVATMNEGFLLIDAEGVVTFSNDAAGRIIGISPEKLLGSRVDDLFDFATRARIHDFLSRVRREQNALSDNFEGGVSYGEPGRTPPTVLCSMRCLRGHLNGYEACILVLTDISELARVRGVLRQRLCELERFQRFFIDRERKIIELKNRIVEYERLLGVPSPGLSDETRLEMERRFREKPGSVQ